MNQFVLSIVSLSFSVSVMAQVKTDFEYPALIPRSVISTSEAKKLAKQVEETKSTLENKKNEIQKEKEEKIAGWVEYKTALVNNARIESDACNKELSCVAQVNKKLSEDIGSVHESIRKSNEHYDKLLFEEQKIIDLKNGALKGALVAIKAAYMAGVIEKILQENDKKGDFRLETNLLFEVFENEKVTREWIVKNMKNVSYYALTFLVFEPTAFPFASFYYRTSVIQSKTTLLLDYNFNSYSYEDLLKQIIDLKENDKNTFGVETSKLLESIISTRNGLHTSVPCIGFDKEKSKFCVGVLYNDAVSLK